LIADALLCRGAEQGFQRAIGPVLGTTAMILDDEMRKDIFRKAAGTAIENSHNAIKQVWVVLFAAGTFALINSFYTLLQCAPAAHPILEESCRVIGLDTVRMMRPNFWIHVLFYVIYVLTFYRFYVGNIRVFDMRYVEVVKFVASLGEKLTSIADKDKDPGKRDEINRKKDELYTALFERLDDLSRVRDSIFLMLKTLFIISLTIQVNNPASFMTIYLIVMLLDILWMIWPAWRTMLGSWSGFRGTIRGMLRQSAYFREMFFVELALDQSLGTHANKDAIEMIFPSRAIEFWTMNNILCVACLIPVFLVLIWARQHDWPAEHVSVIYLIGGLVMLWNCVRDVRGTWEFYNPTFTQAYRLFRRPSGQ
jgi:hypothetical protein